MPAQRAVVIGQPRVGFYDDETFALFLHPSLLSPSDVADDDVGVLLASVMRIPVDADGTLCLRAGGVRVAFVSASTTRTGPVPGVPLLRFAAGDGMPLSAATDADGGCYPTTGRDCVGGEPRTAARPPGRRRRAAPPGAKLWGIGPTVRGAYRRTRAGEAQVAAAVPEPYCPCG